MVRKPMDRFYNGEHLKRQSVESSVYSDATVLNDSAEGCLPPDLKEVTMNLMLTAQCTNTDEFYTNAYLAAKPEFSDWCDSSRCVFAKVDDTHLVELFFDVDPAKLKQWLSKPSTQEMFKAHNFVPTRYTFSPLEMG